MLYIYACMLYNYINMYVYKYICHMFMYLFKPTFCRETAHPSTDILKEDTNVSSMLAQLHNAYYCNQVIVGMVILPPI